MLQWDDPKWSSLEGGRHRWVDLRSLLRALEEADNAQRAWDGLWDELYHQGDVGQASYAAVPHLVRIHRRRGVVDWNTYALVASIEGARGRGRNPEVPDWARLAYDTAIAELAELGREELARATTAEAVRSILAILAIGYGARTYGRFLIEFTEDEVAELLAERTP